MKSFIDDFFIIVKEQDTKKVICPVLTTMGKMEHAHSQSLKGVNSKLIRAHDLDFFSSKLMTTSVDVVEFFSSNGSNFPPLNELRAGNLYDDNNYEKRLKL